MLTITLLLTIGVLTLILIFTLVSLRKAKKKKHETVRSFREPETGPKKYCPSCGYPNEIDNFYCGTCGKKFEQTSESSEERYPCPMCGYKAKATDRYCSNCGYPFIQY